MRIAIHVQREIARLILLDRRQFNSSIAGPLGISKTTVGKLRKLVRKVAEPWERLFQLDDDEWVRTLGTEDRSVAQPKEATDWSLVHQEMQKSFTTGYKESLRRLHIALRQPHVPGGTVNDSRSHESGLQSRSGLTLSKRGSKV